MSDNNIENWENELKEKFNNHQEPTDAKDFDAFMDKLETNDFFEEKGGSGFPVKWIVLVGVLIAGVILWMMNGEKQEKQITPVHKSMKLIEKKENPPNPESKELHSDHEKEKIIQEIETPKESLIIQKTDNKENDKENDHEIKKLIEPIDDDKSSVELEKNIQKDSIKQSITQEMIDTTTIQPKKEELKEESKKVHTPKKHIVIMSTDTTIVTDTSHVKHRKKNRRRK